MERYNIHEKRMLDYLKFYFKDAKIFIRKDGYDVEVTAEKSKDGLLLRFEGQEEIMVLKPSSINIKSLQSAYRDNVSGLPE